MGKKKKKDKHYKVVSAIDLKNAFNMKRIYDKDTEISKLQLWLPYYNINIDAEKITFKDLLCEDGSIKYDKIKSVKFKLPLNVLTDLDMLSSITKKKLNNVKIKPCKNNTEYMNVTMDVKTLMLLWNRCDMYPDMLDIPKVNPVIIFNSLFGHLTIALDKDGNEIAKIAFMQ